MITVDLLLTNRYHHDEQSSCDEEVVSVINLETPSQESMASVSSTETVGSNAGEFAQSVNI